MLYHVYKLDSSLGAREESRKMRENVKSNHEPLNTQTKSKKKKVLVIVCACEHDGVGW